MQAKMRPPRNIVFTPRLAAILFGCSAIALLFGYSLYAALPYLEGPYLKVSAESENGLTRIHGETARVSYLTINENPTAINEDGSFLVRRAYPLGYTAIVIAATDRFGREITKSLSVVTESHGTKKED